MAPTETNHQAELGCWQRVTGTSLPRKYCVFAPNAFQATTFAGVFVVYPLKEDLLKLPLAVLRLTAVVQPYPETPTKKHQRSSSVLHASTTEPGSSRCAHRVRTTHRSVTTTKRPHSSGHKENPQKRISGYETCSGSTLVVLRHGTLSAILKARSRQIVARTAIIAFRPVADQLPTTTPAQSPANLDVVQEELLLILEALRSRLLLVRAVNHFCCCLRFIEAWDPAVKTRGAKKRPTSALQIELSKSTRGSHGRKELILPHVGTTLIRVGSPQRLSRMKPSFPHSSGVDEEIYHTRFWHPEQS